MNQRVTFDFSQVEKALQLSSHEREVLTARERSKNVARLIKYSAAGSALVIVSIGIAFWLGTQWQRHQVGQPSILTELLEKAAFSTAGTQAPQNKVVTNINLFNWIQRPDLNVSSPYLGSLTAGHEYTNNNAATWEHAWCYAIFSKNELQYRVELEKRNRSGAFPLPVSLNGRRELSLSDSDIAYLRARCPWR